MSEDAKLALYADLLKKWSAKINLVSPSTLHDAWFRHFEDSLQVLDVSPKAGFWLDLGSGGGFPGAVVGVAALARGLPIETTLVESDQRKAAFLRSVSRETNTPMTVIAKRIEHLPKFEADIVSARALANLDLLLFYASQHLKPSGLALFPKGSRWKEEVKQAQKRWSFDLKTHKSKTNSEAVILEIGELSRV